MTQPLSHLSDHALGRDLKDRVGRERTATAEVLAYLAEFDARKLYLPAAYPSMYAYCVGELRLTEESAYKRIRVARTARQFPQIFTALADGRLNLTDVILLTPHLRPDTAGELLEAAANKTRCELEQVLAERFPKPDLPTRLEAVAISGTQLSPGTVDQDAEHAEGCDARDLQLSAGTVEQGGRTSKPVTPLAARKYGLQLTMPQETYDKLRYIQDLLGHQAPPGDVIQVVDRAFDALIERLEKRKFAATQRPRPKGSRPSAARRAVPAHVKRAVWARDSGRCTFVSETGRRCPARKCLEFDHVEEVARGGEASVAGIRLRCRAHNQYQAECTFGAGFMERKREEARRAAEARRQAGAEESAREARRQAAAAEQAREIMPWLKRLGFRDNEIRRAVALCSTSPEATLEERVRRAISQLGSRTP
jgi:hypothetical protein